MQRQARQFVEMLTLQPGQPWLKHPPGFLEQVRQGLRQSRTGFRMRIGEQFRVGWFGQFSGHNNIGLTMDTETGWPIFQKSSKI